MPVDINGTTGVTTPGLASTTMPTSGGDAIVESGSNSDGLWTKFADGTALAYSMKVESNVGINGAFNGGYISYQVMVTDPIVFVDAPRRHYYGRVDARFSWIMPSGATSASFYFASTIEQAANSGWAAVQSIGRWK